MPPDASVKMQTPSKGSGSPTVDSSQVANAPGGVKGPLPKCRVLEQPDGGLQVSFLIEPLAGMRLKKKAGGMDLARFIYENYLKREVDSWVY